MIRYSLRCAEDHRFESWFASADAYDSLAAAGRLSCAVCGGGGVEKTLMAPAVGVGEVSPPAEGAAARRGPPATGPQGPLSAPTHPMEAALRALRARIERESDYVGDRFAQEARAIHAGESPKRSVHGEATGAEVRSLIEDGVPVAPLPFFSGRKAH